ncbi:hypothetical protein A9W98_17870 [Mycobacterium gordonae]|uniref:DUF732 domain-containing protein n=1 Tax=Mycobacterium gordonae TaxID=1778 RepID=A0A1A6BHP5_MYCGO|nr:hypothetical protein [Mycobacterium gordonae]OBS01853.1 hypothetical protein A9W98_17870 [Mycobacterium gordonae]
MIRPRTLLLMLFGALIAAAACNTPAHADPVAPQVINYAVATSPAMCYALDAHPTLPGVDGVLLGIQNDSGFTITQSGQALVIGVEYRCPRHLPLLKRYADTWTGPAYTGGTTI